MSNHDRDTLRSPDRDAALDRAWQQASDEQPPPQLDAAIIAAARKAIQDRGERAQVSQSSPRSRVWPAWLQPLTAAAAVAGLAFILVQSLPRDRDVAPSIRMDEPAIGRATAPGNLHSPSTAEATDAKAANSTGPAGAQVPVAATDSEHAKLAVPTPGTATPAAPVPQPADSTSAIDKEPAVESATAMRAVEADQRPAAVPEMTSQAASDAAAAASDAAAAAPARERGNVAPLSAADRAANIAALYASGDVTAAADALRAFRAADPDADAFLPESLRNWARTVE